MEHLDPMPRPRGPASWLVSATDHFSGRTQGNKAALDLRYTAAPSFPPSGLSLPRRPTLGALATALAVGFLAGALVSALRRPPAA